MPRYKSQTNPPVPSFQSQDEQSIVGENTIQQLKQYNIRSLLVNFSNNDFICGICNQFVLIPIECQKCQRLFCKDCLKNYNQPCPYKCSIETIKTNQLHRVVRNQYLQSIVRCPNDDCESTFPLENLMTHDQSCIHKVEECGHAGCETKEKQINRHRAQCIYRYVKCDICGSTHQAKDMNTHNCINYQRQQIRNLEERLDQIEQIVKLISIEGVKDRIISIRQNDLDEATSIE